MSGLELEGLPFSESLTCESLHGFILQSLPVAYIGSSTQSCQAACLATGGNATSLQFLAVQRVEPIHSCLQRRAIQDQTGLTPGEGDSSLGLLLVIGLSRVRAVRAEHWAAGGARCSPEPRRTHAQPHTRRKIAGTLLGPRGFIIIIIIIIITITITITIIIFAIIVIVVAVNITI